MKVHVSGSVNCTKAVWELMREQRYGRIVFTSSASGIYGNFGQANYGAAKAAMIGLMNVLHIEGAIYDIRVNALGPTAAAQMTAGLITEEVAALLGPENVTPPVLYLVGEDAPSWMIVGAVLARGEAHLRDRPNMPARKRGHAGRHRASHR